MRPGEEEGRLELISTRWSLLKRTQHDCLEVAAAAQAEILDRYGGAVRRYLHGALQDPEAAADLFQEFAYRFLRGDFRGACPEKGRFRNFVKGVISHLVADFHNKQGRQPQALPPTFPEPAAQICSQERLFEDSWRDELLARAWQGLEVLQNRSGRPFYTVLRWRAEGLRSGEIALRLESMLQRYFTCAGVRQLVRRARQKFGALIRRHVTASLASDDPEDLEQELRDLGLSDYLRSKRD